MFVKPKEGLKVRDPKRKNHLPASGGEVPETTYWFRRLAVGDVVVVDINSQISDLDEGL